MLGLRGRRRDGVKEIDLRGFGVKLTGLDDGLEGGSRVLCVRCGGLRLSCLVRYANERSQDCFWI